MKLFFDQLRIRFNVALLMLEQWLDQRAEARAVTRMERDNARRVHHIVHRVKSEWIFSGTVRNELGVMQDGGFLRSPQPMRRAQALKYFSREFPNAKILHIDDKNKIITYSF